MTIEYSDDVLRLVADGQAEFGVADATDVMIGRTSGIPIRYVSTLYQHFPVALIGSAGDGAGLIRRGLRGHADRHPGPIRVVVACVARAAAMPAG